MREYSTACQFSQEVPIGALSKTRSKDWTPIKKTILVTVNHTRDENLSINVPEF